MKNLLRLGVLVIYAYCIIQLHANCSDGSVNPETEQTVVSFSKKETKKIKSLAKDETYTDTRTIKFGDELKTKYGFNTDAYSSFFYNSISVAFDKDLCSKLKSYSITVTFPVINKNTWAESTGKCTLSNLASGAPEGAVLYFTKAEPGSDAYVKSLFNTDFLPSIKDNKDIIIEVKMTAKEDIPAGLEITAEVGVKLTVG